MGKSNLFGFVFSYCRRQSKRQEWRKQLFLYIEDVIYLVLFWGRGVWLFFLEKEVGYNEEVIYILKILNSIALYMFIFIWINIISWIWLMSLLAHISSLTDSLSLSFWHFYCSGKVFGIGIWLSVFSGMLNRWCETLLYEKEAVAMQIEINNVFFQKCKKWDFLPNTCEWFSYPGKYMCLEKTVKTHLHV